MSAQVSPSLCKDAKGNVTYELVERTHQGGRGYQEDRAKHVTDLNELIPHSFDEDYGVDRSIRRSVFCIFDGHGGDRCAIYLHRVFHSMLSKNHKIGSDPGAALFETFDEAEAGFRKEMDEVHEKSKSKWKPNPDEPDKTGPRYPCDGATCSVALIVGNKVYVASCGDSTCGAIKKDKTLEKFTREHHTVDPEEVARVIAAGGRFDQSMGKKARAFPNCLSVEDVAVGKPRVMPGGLLVTRSIGDLHAKIPEIGGNPKGVICTPDPVRVVDIQENWQYLVIASDGVWDAMSKKDIGAVLAKTWTETSAELGVSDLSKTRSKFIKEFLQDCVDSDYWDSAGGAADNTTAIFLFF